jgi:hypothetical protein
MSGFWGKFRFVGVVLLALATTQAFAQGVTTQCIVNVSAQGTSDAITSAKLPCGTTTNMVILTAAAANTTTTPTYAPVGSPPLTIIRAGGGPVAVGDLQTGYVALLSSTGTSWVLLNPAQSLTLTGLVPGVTPISPKTNGGVLWDNNGVLGDSVTLPSGLSATNLSLTTPILGIPQSGTLTNATGLPISTGLTGAGTNVLAALGNTLNATGGLVGFGGAMGNVTGHASLDAPLASPTFTGTITGPDSGTWGSGGINGSAIGGVTPEAGKFTTLASNGGFLSSSYNASAVYPVAADPGFIVGQNFTNGQAEVDFWNSDTASPTSSFNFYQLTGTSAATLLASLGPTGIFTATGLATANLLISKTQPTITSGCGGGSPTISSTNGTAAFTVTIGTASGSTCVLGMPTATNGWNCHANDVTTHTTANSSVAQTSDGASAVTLTGFSDITGAATWVNGDKINIECFAR